jgi:hypothetical protein
LFKQRSSKFIHGSGVGLKLLHEPRAPKELPVTTLLCNAHGIAEWKLFLNE